MIRWNDNRVLSGFESKYRHSKKLTTHILMLNWEVVHKFECPNLNYHPKRNLIDNKIGNL